MGKAVSDAVKEIFDPVVTTFISQEIKAGARGLEEIDASLTDTDFGIICLTRSNQTEQWINYEAGALSRQVEDKRLRMGVFLVDFTRMEEVNSPMNIFQCKFATLEDFTDLMTSLNELHPNLSETTLNKRIKAAWPDVEAAVKAVVEGEPDKPAAPPKSQDDKLDELLGLVKAMEASLGDELMIRKNIESRTFTDVRRRGEPITRRILESSVGERRIETLRNLAGKEFPQTVQPRPETDDLARQIAAAVKSSGNVGRVRAGAGTDSFHIASERALPQALRQKVIDELSLIYAPDQIVFSVQTFDDDFAE